MSLIDSKPTKVFIVHGHDELLKVKIARLVEQQGIEAIILSEKENEGKTIIEKLEGHSDVGAAILLFTPDDSGKEIFEENAKPRARQNVVFEAGFFMGKLGRNKTIMVATGKNLELPSDLHGLIYTSDTNWQFSIIREMKAMGFDVDMNKVKFKKNPPRCSNTEADEGGCGIQRTSQFQYTTFLLKMQGGIFYVVQKMREGNSGRCHFLPLLRQGSGEARQEQTQPRERSGQRVQDACRDVGGRDHARLVHGGRHPETQAPQEVWLQDKESRHRVPHGAESAGSEARPDHGIGAVRDVFRITGQAVKIQTGCVPHRME